MPRNYGAGATSSFGEHYLKHIALGEGCNCAESVLRTMAQAPRRGDSLAAVLRALTTRLGQVLAWVTGGGQSKRIRRGAEFTPNQTLDRCNED